MTIPTITLSNGIEMPQLALGTAPLAVSSQDDTRLFHPLGTFNGFLPERAYRSIAVAIDEYTKEDASSSEDTNIAPVSTSKPMVHIDTALYYRTHTQIRHVLADKFIHNPNFKRNQVFITTKIFHPNYNDKFGTAEQHCMPIQQNTMSYPDVYQTVYEQFQQCLMELGLGYVDLMLLHWPGKANTGDDHDDNDNDDDTDDGVAVTADGNAIRRLAAWNVLEDCYRKGWTRAIGVSNFTEQHLERLRVDNEKNEYRKNETEDYTKPPLLPQHIVPMVNQFEGSVFLQHTKILQYCIDHGIAPVAYSPNGRGVHEVTTNETVIKIATKHQKDPGQIAMKYLLQKGYSGIIFWTTNDDRIISNSQLYDDFILDDNNDIQELDKLNRIDGTGSWGLPNPYDIV